MRKLFMKMITSIYKRILYCATLPFVFAQSIAYAFQRGPKQAAHDKNEIERLDRLRNPSKYRGI